MSNTQSILSLIRGRSDNPLAMYAAPWHRAWWYRYLLLAIVLVPAVAYLWISEIHRPGMKQFLPLLPFLAAAFICPIAVFVYAFDFRREERLSELYLTGIHPKEMVFGSLYWSIIAASLPAAIGYLAVLAMTTSASIGILFLIFSSVLIIKSLQLWLQSRAYRITAAPHAIATALGVLYVIMWSIAELGEDFFDVTSPEDLPLMPLYAVLLFVWCIGGPAIFARSEALYYRDLDPELLARLDYKTRAAEAKKQLGIAARQEARKIFKTILKREFLPTFIYSFLGTTISFFLLSIILTLRYSNSLGDTGSLCMMILCGLAGVGAIAWRRSAKKSPHTIIPTISADIAWAGFKSFAPIACAQLLSYALLMFIIQPMVLLERTHLEEPEFWLNLVLQLLFSFVFWLSIIPQRGRRLVAVLLTASIIVAFVAAIISGTNAFGPPPIYRGYPVSRTSGLVELLKIFFTVGLCIICALPVGLFRLLMQRIHDSEVLDHPPYTLSSDAVATNNAEHPQASVAARAA